MNIIVTSFGGVGTSPFLSWLSGKIDCNCPRDTDGFKHVVEPEDVKQFADKFIFIYGDPVEAILSLYARKFIRPQFKKLTGKDNRVSLEEYAESGKDLLGYEKQLDNWIGQKDMEVMFLEYPYFWDYEKEIFDFIGLDDSTRFFQKKERANKKENYSEELISKLEKIYQPLTKKMESLKKFHVVNSETHK